MRNTNYLFFLFIISSIVCSLMILADTVLRARCCIAEDKALIFTHPKDGAKLTIRRGHYIFKGRVVGFDKKEIKDLDLKVLLFKKKVMFEVMEPGRGKKNCPKVSTLLR